MPRCKERMSLLKIQMSVSHGERLGGIHRIFLVKRTKYCRICVLTTDPAMKRKAVDDGRDDTLGMRKETKALWELPIIYSLFLGGL
jgi:hypothetical protein